MSRGGRGTDLEETGCLPLTGAARTRTSLTLTACSYAGKMITLVKSPSMFDRCHPKGIYGCNKDYSTPPSHSEFIMILCEQNTTDKLALRLTSVSCVLHGWWVGCELEVLLSELSRRLCADFSVSSQPLVTRVQQPCLHFCFFPSAEPTVFSTSILSQKVYMERSTYTVK